MRKRLTSAVVFAFFLAVFAVPAQRVFAQEANHQQGAEKSGAATGPRAGAAESRVMKIFRLSTFSQPVEMQDIVNSIRVVGEVSRITQIPSDNALVVSATPEQMAIVEKLLNELDAGAVNQRQNYRIDFKIIAVENGKNVNAKSYGMIARRKVKSSLSIGARVPSESTSTAGSDKQVEYTELGPKVACTIESESASGVVLNADLEFPVSVVSESQPQANTAPLVMKAHGNFELELGKPAIINSFDDPVSKRTFQIEATATRMTGKK